MEAQMKWKEAAIMLLDPADRVIRNAAYVWRERYRIPTERSFSIPYPRGRALAGEVPLGFQPLGPGSLSFCGLGTKLIVVSHGLPEGLALGRSLLGAREFSKLLSVWGLGQVGLLAFKGCLLGRGAFLDRLVAHLSTRHIGVGWLIGYKDVSRTQTLIIDTPFSGPRTTGYEAIGTRDLIVRDARRKLPDDERVKIVKGNRFVVPPGGPSRRYTACATWV
jgi:hypothetical protein